MSAQQVEQNTAAAGTGHGGERLYAAGFSDSGNTSARGATWSRRSRASQGEGGVGATVCWLLTGVTVGAGLMYLLDPDRGRRRRALLRDKCVSLSNQTSDALGRASRDLSNRARGVAAQTSRALGRRWPHEREQAGGESASALQEATQMEARGA